MNAKVDISQLLLEKTTATGTFTAKDENGNEVFSADSVVFHKSGDDFSFFGTRTSGAVQEYIALGISKVPEDGKYSKTAEEHPIKWAARITENYSPAESGKLNVEFSDNRQQAQGNYKMRLENGKTLKGEFDIKNS
ncbi:hypothetical protein [Pseudomonas sp. PDM09]|uniref:hypothetical protein n=1 Tax=Pseudomonas sp. PDM09 TaxID=2769270 RepID=UPI00177C8E06|nr:hypothetical protein [Pseudomonas sp. PDM09]MBD9563605.1 hypothetical protein [Pseudomonas sp. PDM09]